MKLIYKQRLGSKTVISILGIKIKFNNNKDSVLETFGEQWETDYNPQKLEKDLKKYIASQTEIPEYNREIRLILISTLIENNQLREAETELEKYVNQYGYADIYAYPLICAHLAKRGSGDERIFQTAKIFEQLEEKRLNNSLSALLSGKSVAVVGNSPNLIGRNNGAIIDGFDYVVRFNNYRLEGYENDYGHKTDIWICCQANDIQNKPENEIRKFSYILYNVDLMHTKLRGKCFQNICQNLQYGVPISYIDASFKKELKITEVKYPSSGLSGLFHIHNLHPLTRKDIFGFSFLENDTNYYDHYFAKRSKRKIKKFLKNCHHNFEKENIFLNVLFGSDNG